MSSSRATAQLAAQYPLPIFSAPVEIAEVTVLGSHHVFVSGMPHPIVIDGLKEFTLFNNVPREIQTKIWGHAVVRASTASSDGRSGDKQDPVMVKGRRRKAQFLPATIHIQVLPDGTDFSSSMTTGEIEGLCSSDREPVSLFTVAWLGFSDRGAIPEIWMSDAQQVRMPSQHHNCFPNPQPMPSKDGINFEIGDRESDASPDSRRGSGKEGDEEDLDLRFHHSDHPQPSLCLTPWWPNTSPLVEMYYPW